MPAESLPLTDDLWLAAHDTVNGKSRLTPRTLGIGLGAALIAELLFWHNLALERGKLYLLNNPPPQDSAVVPVFNQFVEEERGRRTSYAAPEQGGQSVDDWIAYLAADGRAEELVVNRLSQSGNVVREQRRGLTGKKVVFVPRDSTISGWPAGRINSALVRRQSLDQTDLALAGLFLATALHQQALDQLRPEEFAELSRQLRSELHPMLRELVSRAESAVGEAVMNR
jgi:Golgi phosphoprotein 3 GPP34